MKYVTKNGIKVFSGTLKYDGMTYCTYRSNGFSYVRVYRHPALREQHRHFGEINRNLTSLYGDIAAKYKRDLTAYTMRYKQIQADQASAGASVFGMFKKMMWSLSKAFPGVDLVTITVENILEMGYPIRTIDEAMKGGMLPVIELYVTLEHQIRF